MPHNRRIQRQDQTLHRRILLLITLFVLTSGPIQAQGSDASNVQEDFETLKGQTSFAVYVDGGSAAIKSYIEIELRKNGITILPLNNPYKYPILSLTFKWQNNYLMRPPQSIFSVDLKFKQLFPTGTFPTPRRSVKATTWSIGYFGTAATLDVHAHINEGIEKLTAEFIKDWHKGNPAGTGQPVSSTPVASSSPVAAPRGNCSSNVFDVLSYNETGLVVNRNDTITILASGRVTLGPYIGASGPGGIGSLPVYSRIGDLPHGGLLGRIRKSADTTPNYENQDGGELGNPNGHWVFIGASSVSKISAKHLPTGILDLAVNDRDHQNNSGSYKVEVTICKGS